MKKGKILFLIIVVAVVAFLPMTIVVSRPSHATVTSSVVRADGEDVEHGPTIPPDPIYDPYCTCDFWGCFFSLPGCWHPAP
jgi:hypothetical protein